MEHSVIKIFCTVWIAKDNDGRVFLHTKKPKRNKLGGGCYLSLPYKEMVDVSGTVFECMLNDSGKTIIKLNLTQN